MLRTGCETKGKWVCDDEDKYCKDATAREEQPRYLMSLNN